MPQFPQGFTLIEQRCSNAGERRVLHQLSQCLGDDCWVWHDVPLGPRGRQPDFIVLSPAWGLLVLEVKDWRLSTLGRVTRDTVELRTDRGQISTLHPLRQARDITMAMVAVLERDPALVHDDGPHQGHLSLPYAWGVVLSNLRQHELQGLDRASFEQLFPPHLTLLRDDLDDSVEPEHFQARLQQMFSVRYAHGLTATQRDRLRWHLFPDIRLGTPQAVISVANTAATPDASALTAQEDDIPDLLQVMDVQQEQTARALGAGHRVIHGAAGSGKTMVLVFRARWLAHQAVAASEAQITTPPLPVLVLCYNRALADRLDAWIRPSVPPGTVQVRTYHAWCQDLVRRHPAAAPSASSGTAAYYEALTQAVTAGVDQGHLPTGQYAAVLIDEAHDFEDDWLRVAAQMVSPATRSLLVLYDDAQSIYPQRRRRQSFAKLGIQAQGRTSILRLNYRNTAEVLALALACVQPWLNRPASTTAPSGEDPPRAVQPTSSGRRGPAPVLHGAQSEAQEAAWVCQDILHQHRQGSAVQDMGVLCRTKAQLAVFTQALRQHGLPVQSMSDPDFRRFDWQQPSLKLLTLHSAKGLEFPRVYLCGLHTLPWRDETLEEAMRLVYVGMTRATHALWLSASGPSAVVEHLWGVYQSLHQGGHQSVHF